MSLNDKRVAEKTFTQFQEEQSLLVVGTNTESKAPRLVGRGLTAFVNSRNYKLSRQLKKANKIIKTIVVKRMKENTHALS